jgi:hypothetical protein
MYNLLLYERAAISATNHRGNITRLAQGWHHSTRAKGGYWLGDFGITNEQLTRGEIVDLYNNAIGWRITEQSYGFTTWEGEIVELRLTLDGTEYTRTLDPERWHNKVAVKYPAGTTAWSEDTDSSDLYGESCYLDTVGSPYGQTAAEARRDRRLAEYAFPRSRATGGLSSAERENPSAVSLDVMCAGYVFSVNRRYRTTDTAAANLSAQISTLVGESEFVTAGDITTNTLQVPISTTGAPARLWDIIEELIGMGDASGNEYVGGVYAGRVFDYEAAATTVTYYWRNETLYDAAGNPALPTHIKPNTVVELVNAPRSQAVPGGGTLDKPNRVYIEEVEFIAPNGYRLVPRVGPMLRGAI